MFSTVRSCQCHTFVTQVGVFSTVRSCHGFEQLTAGLSPLRHGFTQQSHESHSSHKTVTQRLALRFASCPIVQSLIRWSYERLAWRKPRKRLAVWLTRGCARAWVILYELIVLREALRLASGALNIILATTTGHSHSSEMSVTWRLTTVFKPASNVSPSWVRLIQSTSSQP